MHLLRYLLLLAAPVWCLAATEPAATSRREFLALTEIDFRQVITAPPQAGSITALAEEEVMRHLQSVRSAEEVVRARYYDAFDVFRMLAPVLGAWCTVTNLPRTAAIFQQIYDESGPTVASAKAAWNRPRPYVMDASLHPVAERPNSASYPSFHAADAALFAVLLSFALPEHSADWQQQSAKVRWSRIVAGVHYPSDTIAGQLLGEAIGREMLKSSALQDAMRQVRAEIAGYKLARE